MPAFNKDEQYDTKNMSVLKRVDFTRNTGLPQMPKSLVAMMVFIRVLPALTQAILGFLIVSNIQPAALSTWIEVTYGTKIEYLAYWMLIFSVCSFAWSFTGKWHYNMVLRIFGNIVFTFPSILYIALADYYVIFVLKTGLQVAGLYTALYITQLSLYMLKAMLAVWFESIRRARNK